MPMTMTMVSREKVCLRFRKTAEGKKLQNTFSLFRPEKSPFSKRVQIIFIFVIIYR